MQRDGENPAQPWLTVILDDYSRAVAGYFLFFEAPSAAQTALALRQAIWRIVSLNLETDRGVLPFGIGQTIHTLEGHRARSAPGGDAPRAVSASQERSYDARPFSHYR